MTSTHARWSMVALLLTTAVSALGQSSTVFVYQGELVDQGLPAEGRHDFTFRLFTGPNSQEQLGPTLCVAESVLDHGRFTIELDFGAVFGAQPCWLEIATRRSSGEPCDQGPFTSLAPRQAIRAAPWATWTADAGTLGGLPSSFYLNAANLSSGILPDRALSADIPRLSTGGAFVGPLVLANAMNQLAGDGSGVTGLNAASLASGIIPLERLPPECARLDRPNSFTQDLRMARVGIGGPPDPSRPLAVTGDVLIAGSVRAESVSLSPTTRYVCYSGAAFTPVVSTMAYARSAMLRGTTAGASVAFSVNLALPHGAVIESVQLAVLDNDDANATITVWRSAIDMPGMNVIATVSSSGASSGVRRFTDSSVSPPEVDNNTYLYTIEVGWTVPSTISNLQLSAVVVRYTVNSPLP